MKAEQLLKELGLTMGLPDLRFDDRGCARLVFDSKVAVNFENDAEAGEVQLYSTLAPLPAGDREPLYRLLCEGNLFGAQTAGATLAVDPLAGEVVLCRAIAVEGADAAGVARLLERFVATAEEWSGRLASGAPASRSAAPAAAEQPPAGTFIRA